MEERESFLTALYQEMEGEYYIELRAIAQGQGVKDRAFIQGLDLQRIERFVQKNEHHDLFFGVVPRMREGDGGKQNCLCLPGLWADVDFKNGVTKEDTTRRIKECPLKPSIVNHSGNGKHMFWLLNEPVKATENLERYLRGIARYFQGDMAAAEIARILRVPGSLNYKYHPPRSVRLIQIDRNRRYNLEDFEIFLSAEGTEALRERNAPGWEKDLISGVPCGERNADATRLAGRYFQMGLHPQEVLNLLVGWNLRNQEPLAEAELRAVIESISHYHPKEEVEAAFVLRCVETNEDGDALLYTRLNQEKQCYDHAAGQWYEFQEHYWVEDRTDNATAAIQGVIDVYEKEARRQFDLSLAAEKSRDKKVADEHRANATKLSERVRRLQVLQRKRNILTLAACGPNSLGISGDEWDQQPWALACSNGVVDLKTGKLRKGKPADCIKTVAPTEWRGVDEFSPTFENTVSKIFDDQPELVEFVQRLLGYSLAKTPSEHVLPIWWGAGRNGKGTLIQAVSHALGPYAGPVPAEMLLRQRFTKSASDPTADIIHLRGKTLVWASETGAGRHLNAGKAKWLVGGDQLIGRPPFGRHMVTFPATHLLILLTNNKPRVPIMPCGSGFSSCRLL